MRKNIIIFVLLIFVVSLPSISYASNPYKKYNKVKKYDKYFRKYTKRFFGPGFNWRHFKAQAIAESRLKKRAKSHVGAKGVMQIMPATFEEIKSQNRFLRGKRSYSPRWNIAAGIFYNRKLWKSWKAKRPFQDRLDFMFGSYNAGLGNIIKAQKIAALFIFIDENLWSSIVRTLPKVTGKHSKETIGYVKRIKYIKGVLK
ncbi:MAG: transglycosylase SLT domain-containing protein [Desulfobacterales bacterium]|nr:transglycosylase SLT domain-containing protein [Desulfobacterales bacterium]MCP4158440.1 transglycosylase SLT domain-containing protein [Deltaproteobacteria bacterium]